MLVVCLKSIVSLFCEYQCVMTENLTLCCLLPCKLYHLVFSWGKKEQEHDLSSCLTAHMHAYGFLMYEHLICSMYHALINLTLSLL